MKNADPVTGQLIKKQKKNTKLKKGGFPERTERKPQCTKQRCFSLRGIP